MTTSTSYSESTGTSVFKVSVALAAASATAIGSVQPKAGLTSLCRSSMSSDSLVVITGYLSRNFIMSLISGSIAASPLMTSIGKPMQTVL